MSLVKVKEILTEATDKRYGVPAINVFNYDSIRFAIKAAELERMPIIIQFYPGYDSYIPIKSVCDIVKELAKNATVPIGLHLDHSVNYNTTISAMKAGYPSVMVDGSSLPFDENVKATNDVVKAAHALGIDVEAELGHVGSGKSKDDILNSSKYTSVKEAVEFVKETGVDSLAVAVGNAHGVYVVEPKLDFKRISQLREALDIPLVMHGGSGIPDDQLQESVKLGFSKFNIATEYDTAFYNVINKNMQGGNYKVFFETLKASEDEIIEFVRKKIRLLNPLNYKLK